MRSLLFILSFITSIGFFAQNKIEPGTLWKDKQNKQINAHGGSIVFQNGMYYWFGEDRTGMVSNGVACYKSSNLYNWVRVGLALKLDGAPKEDLNDIATGRTLERPKVVFNNKTKKWVMWSHWEKGNEYSAARVCVATSDKVEGPYKLYKTFRPNNHDSRDQSLFVDFDGKTYHFCSTDMNTNINVALLSDDYLEPTTTETKILNGLRNEAPAIFRVGDIYFGLFSGCTGWAPNEGRTAYTTNILGEWTMCGNFTVDPGKQTTYRSQSAYILKVEGKENAFVYVGDRWNSNNVGASEYIFLPISMRSGYPTVRWYDGWDLNVFNDMYRYKRAKQIVSGNIYSLLEKQSNRLVSKPANGFTIADDNDEINLNTEFIATSTPNVYKLKDTKTGNYIESVFGSLRLNAENNADSQLWQFYLQPDGYYKIKNVRDNQYLSVSGNSTYTGSSIYLTELSPIVKQDFAVYFDSKNRKYEEADIFSASYVQNNMKLIEKQR